MSTRPRRIAAIAAAVTLGTTAAGVGVASAAPGPQPSTAATASCTKTSRANLQLQREDTGTLSVDGGVDMARHTAGVPWRVRVTDNGATLASTTVRTISDGSFSITRTITPRAGANHVVFTATNLRTGETCVLNGTA
jgi:hypothetical protein